MTRQRTKLHHLITRAKQMTQHTLIGALAPHIRGWSNYYSRVVSAKVFRTLDHTLYAQLRSWAISRHPNKSKHWIKGRCRACGLYFTEHDTLEVDHIIPKAQGGNESDDNLQLLHRHCHTRKTAQDQRARGTFDTRHVAEEPDDAKASRPVLNPSRGGDTPT
jgi:5-methylcytosine-specific restriction endonuclease McrA